MKKIKQAIAAGVISLAVIFSGGSVLADHSGDKEIALVKKGDTIYSLSKKHHLNVTQIKELNDLTGTTIYPGQRLILSGEEAGYHKIIAGSFSKKENAEKRAALLKKKKSLPQLARLSLMAKPITVCRQVLLRTGGML